MFVHDVEIEVGAILCVILPTGITIGKVEDLGDYSGDLRYIQLTDLLRVQEAQTQDRRGVQTLVIPMVAGINSISFNPDRMPAFFEIDEKLLHMYKMTIEDIKVQQSAQSAGIVIAPADTKITKNPKNPRDPNIPPLRSV